MKQLPHGIELIANSALHKQAFDLSVYVEYLQLPIADSCISYSEFPGCVYYFPSPGSGRVSQMFVDEVAVRGRLGFMIMDDYGDLVPCPLWKAPEDDDCVDTMCYLYFGKGFEHGCINNSYLQWLIQLSERVRRYELYANATVPRDAVDAQCGVWTLFYDFENRQWVTKLVKQPPFSTYEHSTVVRSEAELCDGSWNGLCAYF